MTLKNTLYEYKVPLFLTVVGILAFTTFFALTIGLPNLTPQQPPTENPNTTPTETPPTTTPTPTTPTPTPTPPQIQAYENTLQNGATISHTTTFNHPNQTYYYNNTYHYNPNNSLYHKHTAATQNETRRLIERYYTPDNGYIRENDQVNPTKINQTLTTINIHQYLQIRQYLQINKHNWTQTTPTTYTHTTTLQNDPLNPQNGTLTLNATITNNTLQKLTITINPENTNTQYGTKTTITYTFNEYTEPEFYWKNQTK